MKLLLDRKYKKSSYTIGILYVNGEQLCNTIEDVDRGLTLNMTLDEIKKIKKPSITAIPSGTYDIALDVVSPRFGSKSYYKQLCDGKLPRLLNVPGFDGILIHCGNTAADSSGCIIVGKNTIVGKVTDSRMWFEKLYKLLKSAKDAGESITITIK